MKVGFMGLGIMGQGMAPNVAAGGFETRVYNRTSQRAAALARQGLQAADSPAALAAWADVLLLMVTGPEAVDALLFGEQGAAESLGEGKTVVNMSTVPPAYSAQLARRVEAGGASFAEAPVLGSKKPAAEGTLTILAGAAPALVDALEPLLLCMGRTVVRCGAPPAASMMKLSMNLLLGAQMAALCETLHFAEKGGLARDAVLDVVMAGPLANAFYGVKEAMLRSGEYPPQFPLRHMLKDVGFAEETAREQGATAPLAGTLHRLYAKAEEQGLGDEDFAAVGKAYQGAKSS